MRDQLTRRRFLNQLAGLSIIPALTVKASYGSHARPAPSAAPDLMVWLEAHPKFRDAIFWQAPPALAATTNGGPYPAWSVARKQALLDAYQAAWNQEPTKLTDPPPNIIQVGDDDFYFTALKESHAWPLYLAHVAQSLAVEIGNRVPWSINEYASDHLAVIFDSREMFVWNPKYGAYEIKHPVSGSALPAPPDLSFAFLKAHNILPISKGILAPTSLKLNDRRMTIARLFDWCRLNLWHSLQNQGGKSGEELWQYRGFPPVSRIISGTTSKKEKPEIAFQHWTSGCNCTTGFLRAVLRTVNIPVKITEACGHTLPYFPTEGRYLSHGDDLYGKASRIDPVTKKMSYPSDQLFIDQAKFKEWFGSGVSKETKCNNVGRRSTELLVQYPTTFVLRMYCDDLKVKLSHADGQVYAYFKYLYTLPELEATGIWDRLDKELEKHPCTTIPHL